MSKIGKQPITIEDNVEVSLEGSQVTIKGPRGELSYTLPNQVKVREEEGLLVVERIDDSIPSRSLHGTWRSILRNAVEGVTRGYRKELELVGLGYRAQIKGDKLELQVGFSHPVEVQIPEGVKAEVEKNRVFLESFDKQKVGQIAARIRQVRPPEPYKGTGIRYVGEQIRRKPGKAAKALGAGSTA